MQDIASTRNAQALETAVTLRPVRTEDMEFLFRVYASTRADEMALLDWSSAEKQTFLRMQFHAQHQYYHAHFRDARFDIIERDAQPVGRLYVDRRADTINIIDIALLPEHRQGGIGNLLVRALLAEASASGLPVSIHVECNNPALEWYERLGFVRISDQGIYFFMRWSPASMTEKPASHHAAE